MQSPSCLTNMLVIVTLLAFNQMDCTLGLAGSRCAYFVGFIGAFDSAAGLNILAGLTPFLVAWAGIFCDGNNRLNLCASGSRRYFRVGGGGGGGGLNDDCLRKHADQGGPGDVLPWKFFKIRCSNIAAILGMPLEFLLQS